MAKEIKYPTQEWVDKWVDEWLDKNPNTKVNDFKEIEEMAMGVWWEKEIDANRPTPFDLTDEQKKNQKSVMSGMAKSDEIKAKKASPNYKFDKKVRPKDAEKVEIVEKLNEFLLNLYKNSEITNAGQEISFKIGENDYSIKLTKHRNAKKN